MKLIERIHILPLQSVQFHKRVLVVHFLQWQTRLSYQRVFQRLQWFQLSLVYCSTLTLHTNHHSLWIVFWSASISTAFPKFYLRVFNESSTAWVFWIDQSKDLRYQHFGFLNWPKHHPQDQSQENIHLAMSFKLTFLHLLFL